ncbi:MAG TPA: hypothetical protein QGG47_10350 [Acidobacteriota bacterium]|nr:hypothetical protein [Acidobacteriota bacterium]
MSRRYFYTSLTRISDLRQQVVEPHPRPHDEWQTGDYVVGEVDNYSRIPLEIDSGRMVETARGDLVIGALGERAATLEAVGSWKAVGDDLALQALTGAGLFGRATSTSVLLPELVSLRYVGHACVDGKTVRMDDFALSGKPGAIPFQIVLIVGTSMAAGKTTAARTIIRLLKEAGHKVIGAKLTGAGRHRDILSMADAGADAIFDFVDARLPSSICGTERFETALDSLLATISRTRTDVLVAEAGASPLEPYNGDVVMRRLQDNVSCMVLCASDPYAVIGVAHAFERQPDIVCGLATSTEAAIGLTAKLTGLPAVNVMDRAHDPKLWDLLHTSLGL